ncbi:hypothetical protein [Demequina litorisediminis]|uniref:Uncharacterized protein n=1 Tax=Demequina litorisediminis TaxID=1849022 RepID=A0ABQ6IE83_9MICO|nr:hypothetical protein [Demequina litorisediminis]GMA35721.1 hypothetical protein GCM10025876_19250 [Demequina litorisediminis]
MSIADASSAVGRGARVVAVESLRSLRPRAIVTAGVALLALTGCMGEAESPAPSPAITVTRTATPSPSATEPAEAAPFAAPGSTVAGGDDLVLPALAQDAAGTQTEVAIAFTLGDVETGEIDDLAGVLTDAEVDEPVVPIPGVRALHGDRQRAAGARRFHHHRTRLRDRHHHHGRRGVRP